MRAREIGASVGQRLLWLLNEYRGAQGELNCPVLCRIEGELEISRLNQALAEVVSRHEALRTTFARRARQLRQIIHPPGPIALRTLELGLVEHAPSAEVERALRAALRSEFGTPIDPTISPLRASVWRYGPGRHLLCLNLHHLVTDTWSCTVLQREIAEAYARRSSRSRAPSGDAKPAWQFSQAMAWQERQLSGDGSRRHREYWSAQLRGAESLRLPFAPRQVSTSGPRCALEAELDPDTAFRMKELAARQGTTLFAAGLAVFYALLAERTRQEDLAVATLFANRTRPEVEGTIGFLTNLVVLRTRLDGVRTFAEVVARTWQTTLDGMAHQELPFHVASQGAPASIGLDDVVFQMLAEPIEEVISAGDVTFIGTVPEVPGRFDFELAMMPRGAALALKLYCSASRIEGCFAAQMLADYVVMARVLSSAPDALLDTVPVRGSVQAFPRGNMESNLLSVSRR